MHLTKGFAGTTYKPWIRGWVIRGWVGVNQRTLALFLTKILVFLTVIVAPCPN